MNQKKYTIMYRNDCGRKEQDKTEEKHYFQTII